MMLMMMMTAMIWRLCSKGGLSHRRTASKKLGGGALAEASFHDCSSTQVLALESQWGGRTVPTVPNKTLLLASKQRYREKANFWNALVAAPG